MKQRPIDRQNTPLFNPMLRASWLVLAVSMASCGGGGGDNPPPPPPPPPPPVAAEFEVIAGGDACGSGCGGDSSDSSGVGSGADGDGAGGGLGAMRNVKVIARKPDGTVLGSANLLNNLVSLYPRTYTGAFILEFADDGSGNGDYFDEAKKAFVKLQGQTLHVLVPSLTHHLSANPLTEAAYQLALQTHGSEGALTAERMAAANAAVLAAFNARAPKGYAVSDITNYAQAVSDTTAPNSLADTHAGRYGTLLAALPLAASTFNPALAAPALSFMKQLVQDVKDDSTVNNSATVAEPAYDTGIPQALAVGVVTAKSEFGSPEQPAPQSAPTTCFNAAQYAQVGSKWATEYLETDNGTTTVSTSSGEVTRRTPFQGVDALEAVSISDGYSSTNYFNLAADGALVNYGGSGATPTGSAESIFKPAYVSRQFLLAPGETETTTMTAETTSRDGAGNITFGPFTSSTVLSTTFIGYEDVTVAAGVFKNACKFTRTVETPEQAPRTSTQWFTSSGQGVRIRLLGPDGNVSELKSGTVNGQPVR